MKNKFINKTLFRLSGLLILSLWVLLLFFGNGQQAKALSDQRSIKNQSGIGVYELLRLHVPQETRQVWLNAERGSWEPWLAQQSGFLGRELFWDQKSEEAMLLIGWASRAQWKSIPSSEIEEVQERFEKLARDGTGQLTGNPFPVIYEGELILQ